MKRTKFFIGIALLIQAASFIMMFILLCRKRRSLSKAILTVALAGGITGAYLLCVEADRGHRNRCRPLTEVPSDDSFEDDLFFEESDSSEVEICDEDCEVELNDEDIKA